MSQEKLAFDVGLDRTYISHLESNKKSPTVDTLFKICRALKVPISEILARVERALGARSRKFR